MDSSRRNRRNNRRNSSRRPGARSPSRSRVDPSQAKPWSFLSGLFSIIMMLTLMTIIYLMLEYHCTTCNTKCSMEGITKNIDDITMNLSHLKNCYQDLEQQISKFSQELPKLEGQLEVLEVLASSLEKNDVVWNPRQSVPLPDVDVYLAKMGRNGKNVSRLVRPVPALPYIETKG